MNVQDVVRMPIGTSLQPMNAVSADEPPDTDDVTAADLFDDAAVTDTTEAISDPEHQVSTRHHRVLYIHICTPARLSTSPAPFEWCILMCRAS